MRHSLLIKSWAICLFVIVACANAHAQKLSIDVYKTLPLPPDGVETMIIVTKPKVRVYDKPHGKKRQDNSYAASGYEATIEGPAIYGVKMHPSGWPYVFNDKGSGFLNPIDFRKPKLSAFEPWMFNTAVANSIDGAKMRVAINKETGLALKENRYTFDKSVMTDLYIGRMVNDNFLFFFSTTSLKSKYVPKAKGINITRPNDPNIMPSPYVLVYGDQYAVKTTAGTRLDLEKLPASALEKLFEEALSSNKEELSSWPKCFDNWNDIDYSWQDGTDYYHESVSAELMSPPYVNKALAITAYNNAHK